MEYAASGSLLDESQSCKFNDREGRTIIYQTLQGLTYLHEQGVIHRDLKPGNILVTTRRPMHIKVADFGISSKVADMHNTLCGTCLYAAPDIWAPPYTEKIDVWSVGIIVLELWTGLPKYNRETWTQEVLSRKATASRHVTDFLEPLLQLDPNERSSARLCLNLPFVRRSRSYKTARLDLRPFNSETEQVVAESHGQATQPNGENIPDTAIWNPIEPKESLNSPSATAAYALPPQILNSRVPTWDPINPDSWFPEVSSLQTEHRVLRKPPTHPVPEKPQVDKYHFLPWGSRWIAHDAESGTVNVTQILNAVSLHRTNLHSSTVKKLVSRKIVVRGNLLVQGSYLSYRVAVLVCNHFHIDASFLQAFV